MPGYGGNAQATLLRENRQAFLFQQEANLSGVASIAFQPERNRRSLPSGASFQIYFTDAFGNPANPGPLEIDIQDSDIDEDGQYCTVVAWNGNGSLNANFVGRVELPTVLGKYVRAFVKALTNPVFVTVQITDFPGVGGDVVLSSNFLTDAPADGTAYGREDANWVPVVPLAGGTMTGPLVLSGDPTLPLGAATKEYVDATTTELSAALSGILTFAGVIDGPTGDCTFYGPLAGDPSGQLPAAAPANNNYYFICTNSGTPPSGPEAGVPITIGNWLLSDGVAWILLDFGSVDVLASNVIVSPTVAGAGDVQTALTNLNANDANFLPLSGGTVTGNLTLTPGSISVTNGGIAVGGGGISTAGLSSSALITANNGISVPAGNITFGNTSQGYLIWQNNTNAASGPNPVIGATDASNRRLWQFTATQSGNIVGGNPEATLQMWTMDGGYGWKRVMTTSVASPPTTTWDGAMNAPAFNVTSDRRLKKNIREAEEHEHHSIFAALKAVRYEWAADGDPQWNRPKWGFIADDVETASGELVHTGSDGMKGYDMAQLMVLAVAEIQRLSRLVEAPWYRRVSKPVKAKAPWHRRLWDKPVEALANGLRLFKSHKLARNS